MIKKTSFKKIFNMPFLNQMRDKVSALLFSQRSSAMLHEISKVPVVQSGVENINNKQIPFVILQDGVKLYGRAPSYLEREIYRRWKHKLTSAITEDTIRVAMDVVLRYLYPHAMPQIAVPYPRSQRSFFHPQHKEGIWDLPGWDVERKAGLAKIFDIKKGETFLDVGAYIGFGVVRMAREIGSQGNILAVESDPVAFELLKKNIEVNGISNVSLIQKAVGDRTGRQLLFKTERQANSIIPDMVASEDGVEVDVTTIDDILRTHNIDSLDRLSLTINGAEIEAISGMKNTLDSSRSLRMSIAGWYKRNGLRIGDVISPTLKKHDFQVAIGQDGGVIAWKQ
jgi:FkbM family methyltransferase